MRPRLYTSFGTKAWALRQYRWNRYYNRGSNAAWEAEKASGDAAIKILLTVAAVPVGVVLLPVIGLLILALVISIGGEPQPINPYTRQPYERVAK